jgi:hypothetical protein
MSIDKTFTLLGAIAAPVLTFTVDQHWLSAVQATDIGAIIVALIAGLHLNNDQAKAALAAVTKTNVVPIKSASVDL